MSFREVNPSQENLYEYVGIAYDMSTYVRFDKYGLYGIKNNANFIANSPEDIENNASFGLTWHGFFIKNKYGDGYTSITEDEDIKVVKILNTDPSIEVTKIHIGAIDRNSNPPVYGMTINNDNNLEVFRTDDDGNAIFNNVSIRGSIKASVFEYEEIQAIGGIIIVRPSSAIKDIVGAYNSSGITGTEIIIENPEIFISGDYCKLGCDGSCHTLIENDGHWILKGYTPDETINYNDIIGSALVAMARLEIPTGEEEPVVVDNYGIAINSSGSNVQVPSKAISLFEVYPDIEEGEIKEGTEPALRYRGILGTLPDFSGQGGIVADFYEQYMKGTQGIYTDNIYLGDEEQYLAFYTGPNYKKVENPTGSPKENGYYELIDGEYQESSDVEVDGNKTYYYIESIGKHFDIVGSSIDIALNDGDRMISIINASDDEITINSNKINTEDMVIGDKKGTHIHVTNDEIGFWYGKETDDEGKPIEDNKTAYLSKNKLYIPYSVVLNEMEIGEKKTAQGTTPLWAWRKASNDDLRLVWLGGDE